MIIVNMKPLKDIIGENISRIIKESPYTSRDIAKRLNVTEVTIHRWKTGENPPDVANLEALAKMLMVDPAEFYKGSDNVIPMYGNSSIRKAMVIPDEVIEGFYELAGDEKLWEQVKTAIRLRKMAIQKSKKEQEKG